MPIYSFLKSIAAICAANGSSFLFGRFARVRLGGSSARMACRTVFRDKPSCAAIVRAPIPWACKYRIVVQPSTVITRSFLLVAP